MYISWNSYPVPIGIVFVYMNIPPIRAGNIHVTTFNKVLTYLDEVVKR